MPVCQVSLAKVNDSTKIPLHGRRIISIRCYSSATYLSPSEIAPAIAQQLKQKFSSFLGSPSLPVFYFGLLLPKISKGFNYRKEQSLKRPCGAVDAKPLVTSPTVDAASGKVFLSTGTPQTAPDAAMQIVTNAGQQLQNSSKQPGSWRCSWQRDIRVLISNMCTWQGTCKGT